MIRDTSLVLYPDTTFIASSTCTDCFTACCQSTPSPPANTLGFQSSTDYSVLNQLYVADPLDYLWRKYYADLAVKFSKSFHQYSTINRNSHDFEKNFHLDKDFSTSFETQEPELSNNSQPFLRNAKNAQIWRPFSPSPQTNLSSFAETTKVVDVKRTTPINQTTFSPIISSSIKLHHSNSSVFTPVKKKSHVCPKCSTTFLSSIQLNTHMRAHSGSKPYNCDYPSCSKSFARNEELTRHRRIHSGYKPHLCTRCGKSFGRKDHLSKHLKTHLQVSEKKVYLCCVSGCGHRYTRSDALTRHKSTAHSIQKPKIREKEKR